MSKFLGEYRRRKVYFIEISGKINTGNVQKEFQVLGKPIIIFLGYSAKNFDVSLVSSLIKAGVTYFAIITSKDIPHKLEGLIDGEISYLLNKGNISKTNTLVTVSDSDLYEGLEGALLTAYSDSNNSADDPILIMAPEDYTQLLTETLKKIDKDLAE